MKIISKLNITVALFFILAFSLLSFRRGETNEKKRFSFPYLQAGLTKQQAAAHLLCRFTFGAKPGQVNEVVSIGLEKWFAQQLKGDLSEDDSLTNTLLQYPSLLMTNQQIVETYPRNGEVLRMAVKDGIVNKDSVKNIQANGGKKEYRQILKAYMDEHGYKPEGELYRDLNNQKIIRATYSNNQLHEMLTDFWFNHFNVSITKTQCSQYITAYERDAIRSNVTGKFEDLLIATAKSPAMLYYLDNIRSVAADNANANNQRPRVQAFRKKMLQNMEASGDTSQMQLAQKLKKAKNAQGLNENYAREVMELHTLGVDGGYTQSDVTQAAKVLTGWTVYPTAQYGNDNIKKLMNQVEKSNYEKVGFVHQGDFLFNANKHDNSAKTILGVSFPANGGYDEGMKLLTMLAHHFSTSKFICKKIATRFVSDNPPQSLIDKMAKTFLDKDGDIKEVLITMVSAPEFWAKESLREKTKSPFELAISSLRSLDARVLMPVTITNWINKMGEKLYYYQAPTGYPDKGQYWINTGSLLNRMNFGLALATNRIPGVSFNLAAINNNHEPESAAAALETYGKILMPERDLTQTINRLTPLINDPNLHKKVNEAAGKTAPPQDINTMNETTNNNNEMMDENQPQKKNRIKPNKKNSLQNTLEMENAVGNSSMLSQVVGIIIGSPEFQRR